MPNIKNRGETYTEKVLPFFVIKSDEALGQVDAIVSVFGVIDDGNDRIWPNSFVKTITEFAGRVRVLDQHQTDSTDRVLGHPTEMHEVGRDGLPPEVLTRFPTATGGLMTTTQYNMKTQRGSEAFHRIVAGDITEYSIGFNALDTDITIENVDGRKISVRNIRTVKLWEFSPVIWGMNPATATVNAKAGDGSMPPDNKDYQEELEVAIDGEPVSLLGDKIHACLSMSLMGLLTWLYEDGWLSFAEFSQIQLDGISKLQEFRSLIPQTVAEREYERQFYYMLMNGSIFDKKNATPVQLPLPEPKEDTPSPDEEVPNPDELAGPVVPDPNEPPTETVEKLLARTQMFDKKFKLIEGVT